MTLAGNKRYAENDFRFIRKRNGIHLPYFNTKVKEVIGEVPSWLQTSPIKTIMTGNKKEERMTAAMIIKINGDLEQAKKVEKELKRVFKELKYVRECEFIWDLNDN